MRQSRTSAASQQFKRTLLAAKSIAYSDSSSGTYLSTVLFAKLGVAEQVAGKSRKVRGPPSGEPVAAVVARGEAQIGFQQVSEVIHVPGITFVGTIPTELQLVTVYAAVLTRTAEGARGCRRVDPIPHVTRRRASDPEGRTDAASAAIAPPDFPIPYEVFRHLPTDVGLPASSLVVNVNRVPSTCQYRWPARRERTGARAGWPSST